MSRQDTYGSYDFRVVVLEELVEQVRGRCQHHLVTPTLTHVS